MGTLIKLHYHPTRISLSQNHLLNPNKKIVIHNQGAKKINKKIKRENVEG